MRKVLRSGVFTAFSFIVMWMPAIGQVDANNNTPESLDYEAIYNAVMALQPDPAQGADVRNLSLNRDVARFDLHEGEIYLLTPIYGRIVGAVFLGKGTAYVDPPTQIEREQLYRFYKTFTLEKKFTMLFLIFADSTLAELQEQLSFGQKKLNRTAKDHVQYSLKYLSNSRGKYIDRSILKFIFEEEQNSFFHAHFSERKNRPMSFRINPYEVEEVRLMRRAPNSSVYHVFETVNQFHKQADYLHPRNLAEESKDAIKVFHYNIETTIKNNVDFSASAEIDFAALRPGQDWIYFTMYSNMVVDSAFWDNGNKVDYFKSKKNSTLWIRCDTTLIEHRVRTLKLFYHGDLIERNGGIKDPNGWYPRYGVRKASTFELTFHTPKRFTLVSVGKHVSTETEKKVTTTRWVTRQPIRNASFSLGNYESFEINDERIPLVTVYMKKGGHWGIWKNMEEQVAADVANSLAFYQHVFGPTPVEQFYATDIPYLHGQAFPGLIHLSWITFRGMSGPVPGNEGLDEVFRGHEVAHQWWGIEVDFKTYHDQWLSEGFATYSGLWYTQVILKDNEKFFNILGDYRDAIMKNRKYLFGRGQEAGPIWLGYRTSSSKTRGDYSLIIYKKGAWVLHMLRNMMLDLKTMNGDAFTNLMRDFYQTYRGKKASTEDFQNMVEKHVKIDMSWFFNQWVYGTEVPSYRFAYNIEEQEDGEYLVRLRVKQEEVAEDFRMYMMLRVDFGEDRHAYLRILIDGPDTEVVLPLMPFKPIKIEFNVLESVLCEVKKEKWSKM